MPEERPVRRNYKYFTCYRKIQSDGDYPLQECFFDCCLPCTYCTIDCECTDTDYFMVNCSNVACAPIYGLISIFVSPVGCCFAYWCALCSSNFDLSRSDSCVCIKSASVTSICCYNTSVCLFCKLSCCCGVNDLTKSLTGYSHDYNVIKYFDATYEKVFTDNISYDYDGSATVLHGAVLNNNIWRIYILYNLFGSDLNILDSNGYSPLDLCLKNSDIIDIETLKYLLSIGADYNRFNKYGETPLHIACELKLLSRAKILVENGSDPYLGNLITGITALEMVTDEGMKEEILNSIKSEIFSAVINNNISFFHQKIVNDPSSINSVEKGSGQTALHICCQLGNRDLFDFLLSNGASVDVLDRKGDTPLHVAISSSQSDMAIQLIDLSSLQVIEKFNNNDNSVLRIACYKKEISICTKLLAKGFKNVVNKIEKNKESVLHIATKNNFPLEIINILLSRGADPNVGNNENESAFYLALTSQRDDCADLCLLFLRHRADPNSEDSYGTPYLHLALRKGLFSIIHEFITAGVDINRIDRMKNTALHEACLIRNIKICTLLLRNGANPNLLNESGQSPLHITIENNVSDLCSIFFRKDYNQDDFTLKTDVNLRNKQNKTPLQLACMKENFIIIEILINNNCIIDPRIDYFQSDKQNEQKFLFEIDFPLQSLVFDNYRLWFYLIQIIDIDNIEKRVLYYGKKFNKLLRAVDSNGRLAIEMAATKSKEALKSIYLWHDRFRISDTTPIHVSATCFVFRGEDEQLFDDNTGNSSRKVALKLMRSKIHFLRELEVRKNNFDSNYVVNVDFRFPSDSNLNQWPDEVKVEVLYSEGGESLLSKEDAEKMFCLVMPLADTNMFITMKQERWAGTNLDEVKHVGKQMLNCLFHLHNKRVVHADIKPLNLVRVNSQWRLIDMDASCIIHSHTIGLKCTTCYVPPELLYLDVLTSKVSVYINSLIADPSFDVWSFGCVLYQLCNEDVVPLFQGNRDDNLSNESIDNSDNLRSLYEWTESTKTRKLDRVKDPLARNLLAQILMKDPLKRPTITRILAHPFFSGVNVARMIGEKAKFQVFLSYRVASDSDHVEKLFNLLTSRGITVWWDKKCLLPGVDWKEGFCQGLVNSLTFVCLLSRNAINHPNIERQNFSKLTENSNCDNVFLEHRLALELRQLGLIKRVFPVMIGDSDLSKSNHYLKFFGPNSCLPKSPNIFVHSVEKDLCFHMESQALGMPLTVNKTVSSVISEITSCQGAFIEGDGEEAFKKATDSIFAMCKDEENKETVFSGDSSLITISPSNNVDYNEIINTNNYLLQENNKLQNEVTNLKIENVNMKQEMKTKDEMFLSLQIRQVPYQAHTPKVFPE